MHPDTVPCLLELAEEFDALGPARDTASDGSIGDAAHASRSSNHNRDDTSGSSTPQSDSDSSPDIRAIDVDKSGPWVNGFSMQAGVDLIVSRCRSGAENRLVEIIYNKHAWYASNGWARVNYTGNNAHTEHAHFGAKADTGKLENDRRPWGLVEEWAMPTAKEIAQAVWKTPMTDPYDDTDPPRQVDADDWQRYSPSRYQVEQVGRQVDAVQEDVNALKAQLDRIEAALSAAGGAAGR